MQVKSATYLAKLLPLENFDQSFNFLKQNDKFFCFIHILAALLSALTETTFCLWMISFSLIYNLIHYSSTRDQFKHLRLARIFSVDPRISRRATTPFYNFFFTFYCATLVILWRPIRPPSLKGLNNFFLRNSWKYLQVNFCSLKTFISKLINLFYGKPVPLILYI